MDSIGGDMGVSSAVLFHAMRTDGFGERLRALLNAIVLADHFCVDFSFSWPGEIIDPSVRDMRKIEQHHIITDAQTVFSKAFCDGHFSKAPDRNTRWRILRGKHELQQIQEEISDDSCGLLVNALDLSEIFENVPELFEQAKFSRAFDRISFADPIERSREHAYAIDLPGETVAVHLRAGDIVYGAYRFSDNLLGKVVPLPLAAELIQRQKLEGKQVLLFGQDANLCAYLAERYDAIQVSQLVEGKAYSDLQAGIFDITLMSRCSQIYSGNSGFAIFASMISGAERINPRSLFLPRDLIRLTEESPDLAGSDPRISDLQRAFSNFYPVGQLSLSMFTERRLKLVERAVRYDPENQFYKIVYACILAFLERGDEAEKVLVGLCHSITECDGRIEQSDLVHILTAIRPGMPGLLRLSNQLEGLRKLTASGYPSAALCLGFMESALNNCDGVEICNAVMKRYSTPGSIYDRALGFHLARDKTIEE